LCVPKRKTRDGKPCALNDASFNKDATTATETAITETATETAITATETDADDAFFDHIS
jgi:hypothetical protein